MLGSESLDNRVQMHRESIGFFMDPTWTGLQRQVQDDIFVAFRDKGQATDAMRNPTIEATNENITSQRFLY